MKEFTPDKYLGHKINRISRSIDRYLTEKGAVKQNVYREARG